jgi:hypothetical protein
MQEHQRRSRNFICPITEDACSDERCRRDYCVSQIEQDSYQDVKRARLRGPGGIT